MIETKRSFFEWTTWSQRSRRIYIALWPIAAPLHLIVCVIALLFFFVGLFLLCFILGPSFWLAEKIEDGLWNLRYQWQRE